VSRSNTVTRLAARAVWATRLVDRCYAKFDGLRSRLILRHGSNAFHDAFNDVTYGSQRLYRPDAPSFKPELFPWESRVIAAHFPKAPAAVLIGGAGGGREALALERDGYRVVGFEPAEPLVRAFHDSPASHGRSIEMFAGRYQDLPMLRSANGSTALVDLRTRTPFDAAMFGWASFSHIRTDDERVNALRQLAALTAGPILLSYFSYMAERAATRSKQESFAMQVGYFRQLNEADVRGLVGEAGLEIVELKHDDGWPWGIVRRKSALT
jgi:hypothetical protein